MIHVCFALHDKTRRYSKFTGTAMLSLFEKTKSEVTVHILHDNTLTNDNRDKFIHLAEQHNQLVKFYNVEKLCAEEIKEMLNLIPAVKNSRFSIGAFYRLLIPQILSKEIDKIIYLDSDIIVNLDIDELWQIQLGEKVLGVIPESFNGVDTEERFFLCYYGLIKPEHYFNTGVLLINVVAFREEKENLMAGIKFISKQPHLRYFDQDILNYCFATPALKLSNKFNRFTGRARMAKEFALEQKIYHYVSDFGLGLDMNDPFNRLWMSYFIRTPFFDENSIGRLYEGVQQLHVELKQAMIHLSALMSGKKRIFFILPEDIEIIRKIFLIRPDEEIILAEGQHSLEILIDEMRISQGKKVFFIIVANFPFNVLTEAGFINGKDFINGIEFFSEANGVPLNSHKLIKAM